MPNVTVSESQLQTLIVAQSITIENFHSPPATVLRGLSESDGEPLLSCPYPGLAYFGPQDSALFFGRESTVQRLRLAVTKRHLTALVGASGSGKSSVALAGLAPSLHREGNWRFTHFRIGTEPDKDPYRALARSLVPLFSDNQSVGQLEEIEKLAQSLKSGGITLSSVLGGCRSRNVGKRILIIADQFEELFTLVSDEKEDQRSEFIDLLLSGFRNTADDGTEPAICLLFTLRADFYGMALRYRTLADALQGNVENLGPMTRSELRDAIVKPARGVVFEPGLVDILLDEVESRPGTLPLLQFALREMWSRQKDNVITRKHYEDIGRIEGALARRAQLAFDTLTQHGEDAERAKLFRRLFTRLVTLGEGAEDTRRVVDRTELGPDAWTLAQRLAGENNRLIVTAAATPNHETAEVAHEALIRGWPSLIDWINRDRAFHSWLRQIRPRVHEYSLNPSDEGTLLRGGPLLTAEDWLSRRRDELNDTESSYIQASLALRHSERERQERLRLEELAREKERADTAGRLADEQRKRAETAQAARRRVRRALIVTLVALAGAVVFAVTTVIERRNVDRQRNLAVFTAKAMKAISGTASSAALRLSEEAQNAVKSSSAIDQIQTYLDFARYYDDAWEVSNGKEAVDGANALLAGLSEPRSTQSQVGRLKAYSHEIMGDLARGETSSSENSLKEYSLALGAYGGSDAPTEDQARLHRKAAKVRLDARDFAGAQDELERSQAALPADAKDSLEQAMLNGVHAQFLAGKGDYAEAIQSFISATSLLRGKLGSDAESMEIVVELATDLEHLGDAQRRLGDINGALASYMSALQQFGDALRVNPTSFVAQSGMDLVRHDLRLMNKSDEASSAATKETEAVAKRFDNQFASGIGSFKYGMSPDDVNALLQPPYPSESLKDLPIAQEYRTAQVRYFWRYFRDLTQADFDRFTQRDPCLLANLANGYVSFEFHEDHLFHIAERYSGTECATGENAVDHLAQQFGLAVSGATTERRLRYDTPNVGVRGVQGSIDFVQR